MAMGGGFRLSFWLDTAGASVYTVYYDTPEQINGYVSLLETVRPSLPKMLSEKTISFWMRQGSEVTIAPWNAICTDLGMEGFTQILQHGYYEDSAWQTPQSHDRRCEDRYRSHRKSSPGAERIYPVLCDLLSRAVEREHTVGVAPAAF